MWRAGLLMAGTIYQALRKLLFQMSGPGLHGQVCFVCLALPRRPPPPPVFGMPRLHCRFPIHDGVC